MATVSIQVPMLETKLPVQTVANARCRNGRNGDTRFGWAGLVTQQGYPWPAPPARALLQGEPELVQGLGGAAEPAAALVEHRPRGDDPAGAAGGLEHTDRAGEQPRPDGLAGGTDGQVEEAVEVEVVEEEPAGEGGPEAVEVLGVGLQHQAAPARPGGRPGQQVDRAGVLVGTDVLAGDADGQVPLPDAVAVGRRHRRAEQVPGLGVPGDAGGALEQQSLVGQAARRAVDDADRPGRLPAVHGLAGGAGGHVVALGVVEVAGGHGGPERVAGLGVALGEQRAVDQPGARPGEDVDRPRVHRRAQVLPGGADDQVVDVVAGHDGRGQRGPEQVAALGGAADPAALDQRLVPGRGQAARPPEQDGDRAGVAGGPDVLGGGADGQVEEAVAVVVAGGQHGPELVDRLGVVLREQGAAAEAAGRPGQDVDGAGGVDGTHVLARRPDGHVKEAVGVEVALGDRGPEPVPGLKRPSDPAGAL